MIIFLPPGLGICQRDNEDDNENSKITLALRLQAAPLQPATKKLKVKQLNLLNLFVILH